jgi:hypothetical protein
MEMENAMKRYNANTPRAVLGLAAIALTAATLGLGVALPVSTGPSERVQAIASGADAVSDGGARIADVTAPAIRYIEPIEVVAIRDRNVSSAQDSPAPRKRGTQG